MGLSHTVSEMNVDFGRKPQVFPIPTVINDPFESYRRNFVTSVRAKLSYNDVHTV